LRVPSKRDGDDGDDGNIPRIQLKESRCLPLEAHCSYYPANLGPDFADSDEMSWEAYGVAPPQSHNQLVARKLHSEASASGRSGGKCLADEPGD
jgi:hypothetical protein